MHAKAGDLIGAIPFLEMAAVLLADIGDVHALVLALSNSVVVFEQYYLEPAQALRSSFLSATTVLSARCRARLGT